MYGEYWNGSSWVSTGTTHEAEVKSLGAGSANALGLYDMSGNVCEWCFTEYSGDRVWCSGGWDFSATFLQVGSGYRQYPGDEFNWLGFRLCRTAD